MTRYASWLIAAAAALCLGTSATGSTLEPPARFDHPYDGPVELQYLPKADIRRECGQDKFTSGCAWVEGGTCHVLIALYTPKVSVARRPVLVRHEIAHCNGWPGDHPR